MGGTGMNAPPSKRTVLRPRTALAALEFCDCK
jgi:hypothetical protein